MERIVHPFPPFFDSSSRILILGSFPSVKSREQLFFYGHPQNRFWKVLLGVFSDEGANVGKGGGGSALQSIAEKKKFLSDHHIALWDVIGECDISGSSDASIRNVVPNDLSVIFDAAPIEGIFLNGRTAEKYYKKYIGKEMRRDVVCLPSTSPANAVWSLERLIGEWSRLRTVL